MAPVMCIIVGDRGVGKYSLAKALSMGKAPAGGIGIADRPRMEVLNTRVKMCIKKRDVNFRIRNDLDGTLANLIMICFSVVNRDSWNSVLNKWIPEIQKVYRGTPFILVGTHRDQRADHTAVKIQAEQKPSLQTQEASSEKTREEHQPSTQTHIQADQKLSLQVQGPMAEEVGTKQQEGQGPLAEHTPDAQLQETTEPGAGQKPFTTTQTEVQYDPIYPEEITSYQNHGAAAYLECTSKDGALLEPALKAVIRKVVDKKQGRKGGH